MRTATFLLLLLASPILFAQGHIPKYGVVAKWQVGGDGRWDDLTMDADAHRLYVSRSTHVMVIDTDTGKVVGDLPNTNGVHGIAIAAKEGKGFASDGRDNTVTVFDLKTLKETGTIAVGNGPDAIIYDKSSHRVFTFNGGGNDATAIDARTEKVVGTVKLDGRPEFAATDGKGTVYVNIEDKSELQRFDPKTLSVAATWPLKGESPSGLALDIKHHLLFSTCDNKVMSISDGVAGLAIGTATIGDGPDGAGFDQKWGLAFSSNGQAGTLTILKRNADGTFTAQDIPTQLSARTMTVDQKTHRIFLPAAEFGPVDPNAPAGAGGQRRRPMVPGSFTIIVVGPVAG